MAKKIKICILMPGHYSDVMGGAQYQVKCLIDILIQNEKFEVYYIARNTGKNYQALNYHLKKVQPPFGIKRTRLFFDALPIYKLFKTIQPDIIYQRVASAYTGIAALYANKHQCRFVWHVSSDMDVSETKFKISRDMLLRYVDNKFLKFGIKHANQIVTQTNIQADFLKNTYGINATAVIPNFHPLPVEIINKKPPTKVVWIANLKAIKQPEIFIQLANDLQENKNIEFIMMGKIQVTPKREASLREQINALPMLNYLGEVSQEKVNQILAESDILVNTSKYEGFSNTFIQAWMREVPVVSLSVNPDNLLNGENLGFHSQTYDKLLENIKFLVENEEFRKNMGKNSKTYAFENHSQKNAQCLVNLFLDAND